MTGETQVDPLAHEATNRLVPPQESQLSTALVGCSGDLLAAAAGLDAAGVWPALHELLLAELRATSELDLDRCAVDGSHIRALKGGTTSARRRSTAAGPAPSTT